MQAAASKGEPIEHSAENSEENSGRQATRATVGVRTFTFFPPEDPPMRSSLENLPPKYVYFEKKKMYEQP